MEYNKKLSARFEAAAHHDGRVLPRVMILFQLLSSKILCMLGTLQCFLFNPSDVISIAINYIESGYTGTIITM